MKKMLKVLSALSFVLIVPSALGALPTALSDRIYKGSGTIDILKDVTGAELSTYINENGAIYLGVDLNEAASGLESSDSVGVAIQDMTISIQTTAGTYRFSNFQTNTTASILSSGSSAPSDYYTLFGTAGSNQVTGGTADFNVATFDDVIQFDDIAIEGEITSASIEVVFVDTSGNGDNETFFDYGAGFEEFAVIGASEADSLDAANIGISDATPTEVSFAVTVPTGTPEPWWFLVLALPMLQLMKRSGGARS